jgi:hypothetical protein
MTARTFELAGSIELQDVPDVRRFVEKLHRRIVHDGDDVSRVIMAAHELLENAVKFSADGSATLHIEVTPGAHEVCITTRNRARPSDVEDLRRIAAELGAATDPMSFYLSQMHRSPETRGGLGLGRVAAEGEMAVQVKLDGDVVEINARSALARS